MQFEKMFSIDEVCEILGTSRHTTNLLIARRKLQCLRLNARIFRVRASDLKAFLDGCRLEDKDLSLALLEEKTQLK